MCCLTFLSKNFPGDYQIFEPIFLKSKSFFRIIIRLTKNFWHSLLVITDLFPGQPYCLELTLKGWRVTSLRHDCMQGDYTRLGLFTVYYDTLYDLMDKLSPNCRNVFNEKLAQKLQMLQASSIF